LELSRSKLKTNEYATINGGHSSRVNNLRFVKIEDNNNNSNIQLFSISNDKSFCQWKLNERLNSIELIDTINVGDVNPSCIFTTTNICHNPINSNLLPYAMIGCNNILVQDIVKKKIIGSYVGHASLIRHFKLSGDNCYLFSSAEDRFIYVWKLKRLFFQKK